MIEITQGGVRSLFRSHARIFKKDALWRFRLDVIVEKVQVTVLETFMRVRETTVPAVAYTLVVLGAPSQLEAPTRQFVRT